MQREAVPEEEETVQTKGDGNPLTSSSSVESGINSLRSGGSPLPESNRVFFEPRFGADFSEVRMHTDSNANHLARSINAKAFTTGKDIVFGSGQYSLNTSDGKRLLAHELTHVVQQNGGTTPSSPCENSKNTIPNSPEFSQQLQLEVKTKGESEVPVETIGVSSEKMRFNFQPIIQRFPYETRGIALNRAQITALTGQSYWEQRTFRAFVTALDPRLTRNPEERDAVLSALWATNPSRTVRRRRVQFLPVASRILPTPAGQPSQTAPQLLYKLTFQRPASRGALPRLEIAFVASGVAATTPTVVPVAPANFQPATPNSTSFSGFPASNSITAYWTAHPQEHRAVFSFIENTAPASFDQIIEATTVNNRGRVTHRSVFRIVGQHTGSTINRLSITLVNQGAFTVSAQQTVPANYRDRDMGDLEMETQQARTPAANRLGTVTLPANLPADERLPVKYTVWQYFAFGNQARNTEVDAIVPVGSGGRTVLYTLIFGAHNNVTVTRVGEAGTATGQVDVQRISVTRVRGFPGVNATPVVLRTWWSTRYPRGGTLTPVPSSTGQPHGTATAAPTSALLVADMNRLITAGIANRTWFTQNYGIDVLDAAGTAMRLQNAHNVPQTMTGDTVDLSVTDLRMLELSLQTLSDNELRNLRGIKLGRKTSSIQRTNSGYQAGSATRYGLTLMNSSGTTTNITVLYFQPLYANTPNLFRGSTATSALPDVTMGMLHELGHAAEYKTPAIRTAFQAWISRHPQTAPTWYAARSRAHELFPETFALYHTDPHFLCNQSPLLYAWFHQLATTGRPPGVNATLTAPATCPP